MDCIRKRLKRNADCDTSEECQGSDCSSGCGGCDCNFCEHNQCESSCSSCCSRQMSCTTHHCCHRKCHAQCKSTGCRRDCRKSCTDKIRQDSQVHLVGSSPGHHNITTIINLKNVVNNTNVIDMPISVNNTNINNITLQADSLSSGGLGGPIVNYPEYPSPPPSIIPQPPNIYPPAPYPPPTYPVPSHPAPIYPPIPAPIQGPQPCCHIISPRQCQPVQKFPYTRCFHLRSRKCGSFCSAPIVHEQPHQICDEEPHGKESCHNQVVYIPQPQPRCWSTPSWPYINCGIQSANCEGCYTKENSHCSSACFDDGFGAGPMYRQGPFYRSGFSPVPSCMQTGRVYLFFFKLNNLKIHFIILKFVIVVCWYDFCLSIFRYMWIWSWWHF